MCNQNPRRRTENILKYNGAFDKSVIRPLGRNIVFNELRDNDIKIVFDKYRYFSELYKANIDINSKNDEIERISNEKNFYYDKLQSIYNSKRFKFVDRCVNLINKLRFKK